MKGKLSLEFLYANLLDLMAGGNNLMFGFGNTTPWSLESMPPTPDETLIVQDTLQGFIPITLKRVVKEVTASPDYTVGNKLYDVIAANLGALRAAQPNKLLARATLFHDDLPSSSYRSIGIYTDCVYTPGSTFYSIGQVTGYSLVYTVNLPPVLRQSNLEEIITIVAGL